MGIKSMASKPFAAYISNKIDHDANHPCACQRSILKQLLRQGKETKFGKKHHLSEIRNMDDFKQAVPLSDYEEIRQELDSVAMGEPNIFWPGLPIYFAKTSGTTSGNKYIPITSDSIANHINSARNALLRYIHQTGNSKFADYKMIFLQGSPILEKHGVIDAGRLSGIVAHHVPKYLQNNRLPSWNTNCIDDWETKVKAIIDETLKERMSLISGIPPWLRIYFEQLKMRTGKPVGEIFPDLQLLVVGGVNLKPYMPVFDDLLGRKIDTLEIFPASEGFFAFQDMFPSVGMLLTINSGILYEFIPLTQFGTSGAQRLSLDEVKLDTDYALVISSNAGLWGYSVGDTVRFTSLNPYRIIVSGRVSQFISAFGEHVIASEIEAAMTEAMAEAGGQIAEFTVAPFIAPEKGQSRHEWFIEFITFPQSIDILEKAIDQALCRKNTYYNDLRKGNILARAAIRPLSRNSFERYLKSKGALGGQNKVPRLANNRHICDELIHFSDMTE